jgi:hypothetical protein
VDTIASWLAPLRTQDLDDGASDGSGLRGNRHGICRRPERDLLAYGQTAKINGDAPVVGGGPGRTRRLLPPRDGDRGVRPPLRPDPDHDAEDQPGHADTDPSPQVVAGGCVADDSRLVVSPGVRRTEPWGLPPDN